MVAAHGPFVPRSSGPSARTRGWPERPAGRHSRAPRATCPYAFQLKLQQTEERIGRTTARYENGSFRKSPIGTKPLKTPPNPAKPAPRRRGAATRWWHPPAQHRQHRLPPAPGSRGRSRGAARWQEHPPPPGVPDSAAAATAGPAEPLRSPPLTAATCPRPLSAWGGGGRETPLPGLRRGGWARPAAGVPSPRPRPPAVPYPGRCSRRRPRCSSGASTWCAAAGPGASCRANGSPPPAPARRPSRDGSAQAHGNATRSATGAIHQAAYASAGLRPAGQRRVVRGGSGSPCSLLAKGRQSA